MIDSNTGNDLSKESEPQVVTQIQTKEGITYFLLDDGFLYKKLEDGSFEKLDYLNKKSKDVIDKIMKNFEVLRTDVIDKKTLFKRKEKKQFPREPDF